MLPARHRVRRSSDFAAATRGGIRAGQSALVVHLRVDPGAATWVPPRAGFVVSRAVGGAVVRNRVRRRLRHLVAERLAALPPGSVLVVRALPAAAALDGSRLAAALDRTLARALAQTPGPALGPTPTGSSAASARRSS